MTKLLCVLKGGGVYGPQHVKRLRDQVYATTPGANFCCLTDMPEVIGLDGVHVHALCGDELSWPNWFAKLALFRLPGPILYLDLDVNVLADLTPMLEIAAQQDFVMSEGFWPNDPNPRNSSVMAWRADAPAHIYDIFAKDTATLIERHTKMPGARTRWGDQGLIATHYGAPIPTWQQLHPGAVVSFKRGAKLGADLSRCRVLCSHGLPKPWNPGGADEWLAKRR